MKLRRLTRDGILLFSAYLTNLKTEPNLPPPEHLLSEEGSSDVIDADVEVEPKTFRSRLHAAEYLDEVLRPSGILQIERDIGIWSWLALFYFDQICPLGKAGGRKVAEQARYIPQIDMARRYYRHMLLGPWMMLQVHRDQPDRLLALLSDPMHVATSEAYRLFIENPTLISCKAVVETAKWLYFDPRKGRLKRGSGTKVAGGCRRLIQFLQQLDCTFDLSLLTEDRLRNLLPNEFHRFFPKQLELIPS